MLKHHTCICAGRSNAFVFFPLPWKSTWLHANVVLIEPTGKFLCCSNRFLPSSCHLCLCFLVLFIYVL